MSLVNANSQAFVFSAVRTYYIRYSLTELRLSTRSTRTLPAKTNAWEREYSCPSFRIFGVRRSARACPHHRGPLFSFSAVLECCLLAVVVEAPAYKLLAYQASTLLPTYPMDNILNCVGPRMINTEKLDSLNSVFSRTLFLLIGNL